MSTTTTIEWPCGGDCPTPALAHREPEPDWIGDMPIMHGESDYEVPGSGFIPEGYGIRLAIEQYCLCGHPNYLSCPGWFNGGGIGGMVIERGPNWTSDGGVSG